MIFDKKLLVPEESENYKQFYEQNLREFELSIDSYSLADALISNDLKESRELVENFVKQYTPCFIRSSDKRERNCFSDEELVNFYPDYIQLFNAVRDYFR